MIYAATVVSFKNNTFGSIKVNVGGGNVYLTKEGIANVQVVDNTIGSFVVNCMFVQAANNTFACFYHTGSNGAVFDRNTIHSMVVNTIGNATTNSWNTKKVYCFWLASGSNHVVTNNFVGKLVARAPMGSASSFVSPGLTTVYGVILDAYAIMVPNSSTKIANNNVGVYSDHNAWGIYNTTSSGNLPTEMNENNTVYVETFSQNQSLVMASTNLFEAVGFFQIKQLQKSKLRPGHTVKTMYRTCYSDAGNGAVDDPDSLNETPSFVTFRV